ncbi:MAG: hypothetical protein LBN11_00215, partial [Tannerella sp.]|nr:hypothetical protein [Tannerella sp.]
TILEHFCENKEEKELAGADMFLWNNMNDAYCQSIMGYRDRSGLTAGSAKSRGWDENRLITYQESHDEERTMYKAETWGITSIKDNAGTRIRQAQTNAAFLACTPGPKMGWQFGELGYDYSIDYNGRTGKKPVKWDYYDDSNRVSLYETYSKLFELRGLYPELFSSPETEIMKTDESDWESGRFITLKKGDSVIVLAGNFTDNDIQTSIALGAKTPFSVTLPPHSYKLYMDGITPNENIAVKNDECKFILKGETLTVEYTGEIEQVTIYTFGGKPLKSVKNKISTTDIPKGIYLATARTPNGKVFSKKIVIR